MTQRFTHNPIDAARSFTIPIFRRTLNCDYVEFYAFDPDQGRLRRKRIKINRIEGSSNRRTYARGLIKRLTEQLNNGWNPWIAKDVSNLVTFEEAMQRYESHLEKMIASGYFRKETYSGYKSYVKIMRQYIMHRRPLYYCYQFDRKFCVDFLDYVFVDRNNGAQTRNNYLNFLRVFSGFLVEKDYLKTRPTDGINPISRRLYQKERECIPTTVVSKIADYCKDNDPHFLLACYLLYYCFIRPVEMTRLKVRNFNIKESTVTIPAECSKNKMTQTVTLPKKVLQYAIELGIFSAPMDDYIFSCKLKPGMETIDPKIFRDHWEKARKTLKLKKEWKFYSLKDTGITEMLDNNTTSIAVRDQARHSSLAITEIYTRHRTGANKDLLDIDGAL
ncbi:MAG: tyrosine-type recombinase/integrase [Bacteroides sp.]|nr:tyrosine-type recombinase/integrase [Bacteroides sp.]MCM1380023.1 tyrosine-type recombinase/integrase [Bacteroides sp.]